MIASGHSAFTVVLTAGEVAIIEAALRDAKPVTIDERGEPTNAGAEVLAEAFQKIIIDHDLVSL